MRWITLLLCLQVSLSSCRTTEDSSGKSVEDIASVSRPQSGAFVVTCRDRENPGSFYEESYRTAEEYRRKVSNNSICERGGNPDITCEPASADSYYLRNIRTNTRIGNNRVSLDICRQIISNSANNWTCEPWSADRAYLYNLELGLRHGNRIHFDTCFELTRRSTPIFVCEPFSDDRMYISRRTGSDLERVGAHLRYDQCYTTIENARSKPLICEPWSDDRSYLYRIDSSSRVGARISSELCRRIVAESTDRLTCEPSSEALAYLYDLNRQERIGARINITQCIEQVSPPVTPPVPPI